MKYRRAVFVVVYTIEDNKIKYLILKRKLHWKGWEFPKGGFEKNESARNVVIREVKEETGLKPLSVRKFDFSGRYKYPRKFSDRKDFEGQSFVLYSAEVKKGKVKVDGREHSKAKWMSFEKAVRKVKFANQKKSLKIVNEWLDDSTL